MLIICLKELRRLQQERRAQIKYPHTSSRKSLARLEDEIKLQRGHKDLLIDLMFGKSHTEERDENM